MAKVTLDGLQLELPADAAGPVNNYVLNSERQHNDQQSELESLRARVDALEEALDTATTERETAEGRADALEAELLEVSETRDDSASEWDTARLDEELKRRLDSLQRLSPAFPDEYIFDGVPEDELYAQAFENLTGEAPDEDADFSYIRGAVDGLLLAHADADPGDDAEEEDEDDDRSDAVDHTVNLRQSLKGVQRSDSTGSGAAAYRARMQAGHKQPLKASVK